MPPTARALPSHKTLTGAKRNSIKRIILIWDIPTKLCDYEIHFTGQIFKSAYKIRLATQNFHCAPWFPVL